MTSAKTPKKDAEETAPEKILEAGAGEPIAAKTPPLPEVPATPVLEASPAKAHAPPKSGRPPAFPAPPPVQPAKASSLYRVWDCGTLQHNGTVYQPGDKLVMHDELAATIPCLIKVDG